jgi:hypothetical protein
MTSTPGSRADQPGSEGSGTPEPAPLATVTLTDGTVVQYWAPAAPGRPSGAGIPVARPDTTVLRWRTASLPTGSSERIRP